MTSQYDANSRREPKAEPPPDHLVRHVLHGSARRDMRRIDTTAVQRQKAIKAAQAAGVIKPDAASAGA